MHRPHCRAGVENPCGQRPLALGKPFGHGFDGTRKIPCLSHPQQSARYRKGGHAARQGLPHGGKRPPRHGQRKARPRAQPVDDPPEHQHHDGVGKLEGEDDPAIVALRHAEDLLHMMGEDRDGAAINVVDDGAKEQDSANQPTQVRQAERIRGRRGNGTRG